MQGPLLLQLEDPQQGTEADHGSLVATLKKGVHGVCAHRPPRPALARGRPGPLTVRVRVSGRGGGGVDGGEGGWVTTAVRQYVTATTAAAVAEEEGVHKSSATTEQRGEEDHILPRSALGQAFCSAPHNAHCDVYRHWRMSTHDWTLASSTTLHCGQSVVPP